MFENSTLGTLQEQGNRAGMIRADSKAIKLMYSTLFCTMEWPIPSPAASNHSVQQPLYSQTQGNPLWHE